MCKYTCLHYFENKYNEEETASLIVLDFPNKSEHIFDFDIGESREKEEKVHEHQPPWALAIAAPAA